MAGAVISWNSKKQPTVAKSSCEAEYMAASSATQEAIYLRMLLKVLNYIQNGPTTIYQDNQSAMKIANNRMTNLRTKHIDIQHPFIRERIESREIKVEYLPTEDMVADCLTKPLSRTAIEKFNMTMFNL